MSVRKPYLRRGLTLVDALVSAVLLALAGAAILYGVESAVQTTQDALERSLAEGLAQQLMDEIAGQRYHDPATTPYQTPLGPTAWENLGAGRERYNDIDDYNDYSAKPPVDLWGVPLGADDGAGGQRHVNFRAPTGFLANYRQRVNVYYVSDADPSVRLTGGLTSNHKEVVVTISIEPPDRGSRPLATLRRVFSYVPSG